ncbi:hypothetical protein KFE25_003093 [Diacronema lutheri]|uniref:TraB domain-containing protein n=1 Tax=Diacronema lutheri TaxID=2081491 RepID=A0A8J6C8K4_DIALT|nr:hypothetical protein KFE25_003093 [Diacronema lutheri]
MNTRWWPAAAAAVVGAGVALPLPEAKLPARRRVSFDCCGGGMRVTLLGVHHASADSAAEAADLVRAAIGGGRLVAIALESDDETLAIQRAASAAVGGMSKAAIRRHGERAVQRALFELPAVRHRFGSALARPEQIALSAELRQGLAAGRVHGYEMAVAADLAERAAVRVECIDSAPSAKGARYEAAARADGPSAWRAAAAHMGEACEIRARVLLRGGSLRLTDQLAAMRRFKPATYTAAVDERDDAMSARIGALCGLVRPHAEPLDRTAAARAADTSAPAELIVLCGAAHLPGIEARLRARGCEPCALEPDGRARGSGSAS